MEHQACSQRSDPGIPAKGRQKYVVTTVGNCHRNSIPLPGYGICHTVVSQCSGEELLTAPSARRVESINIYFFLQYSDQFKGLNLLFSLFYFDCDQVAQNRYFRAYGLSKFLHAKLMISSSFGQNGITFCSANNSHFNRD